MSKSYVMIDAKLDKLSMKIDEQARETEFRRHGDCSSIDLKLTKMVGLHEEMVDMHKVCMNYLTEKIDAVMQKICWMESSMAEGLESTVDDGSSSSDPAAAVLQTATAESHANAAVAVYIGDSTSSTSSSAVMVESEALEPWGAQ